MGSRGAFVNVDSSDFTFVENGQIYHTIGFEDGIKFIYQEEHKSGKKIPDYSHEADTIYVLIANNQIKQIGVYKNHIKTRSIDLLHSHTNKLTHEKFKWHVHTDLFHQENATSLSNDDLSLVEKVFRLGGKYL